MRIAHLCLSNFYVDGFGYQENELVREHVRAGHDVQVFASTESLDPLHGLIYLEPSRYLGTDGAWVTRLPYGRWLPHRIMRKLRAYPGVYKCLSEFKPNTILFHGTCAWALRATARYAYDNPGVPLYVDSHEDSNNSGRSFVSRELLHKRFYGPIIRSSLPWIRKILAISTESIDFVTETYGVPRDKLEFYPLGGRPLPDDEYSLRRRRTRKRLGLTDDQIAITHVGKQHPGKKLVETLDAFSEVDERRLRLFVGGSLQDSIRAVAEQRMAADERVTYLGWQDREGLADLLCAADVYVQPGSQSATMQHSLCCRCAVILNDVPAHRVYQTGNGWFVSSRAELVAALREVVTADLAGMQANSFKIAQEMLDYSVLAERILR